MTPAAAFSGIERLVSAGWRHTRVTMTTTPRAQIRQRIPPCSSGDIAFPVSNISLLKSADNRSAYSSCILYICFSSFSYIQFPQYVPITSCHKTRPWLQSLLSRWLNMNGHIMHYCSGSHSTYVDREQTTVLSMCRRWNQQKIRNVSRIIIVKTFRIILCEHCHLT